MEQSSLEGLIRTTDRLRAKLYTLLLRRCFLSIGARVSISPPMRFANLSLMRLGNNVTIHSNCWIQALPPYTAPKILVGNNVSIGMDATISAAKKITIGDYVFTARNVYISDHGHAFRDVTVPTAIQGVTEPEEVNIGSETWIGQNAVILPGVTIGRHCVIGANSVVNSDIPDYSVAAGTPARVIRTYNFASKTWERIGG
jgi:acetyltransferase-like isoleucine patch superfamily enzyme